MPNKPWNDNQYRGVALNKMFKRIEKRAERYDAKDRAKDDPHVISLAYCMERLSGSLNNLAKVSEIEELKKEVAELKKLAGLAQANQIVK